MPLIDAFANIANHQASLWFGPGGIIEDAFLANWAACGTIWLNPPYSSLDRVFAKFVADRAVAVAILPDWRAQEWWKLIQPFIKSRYLYPCGTRVFQVNGQVCPPIKWGVWAYIVDSTNVASVAAMAQKTSQVQSQDGEGWKVKTKSSTRRWRRQLQKSKAKV